MKYLFLFPLTLFFVFSACSLLGSGDNTPEIPGKIVFSSKDNDDTSQIYTMKANGADVKQLTHFDPSDGAYFPSWSPDGSQIVFSTTLQSSSNGFSLFIMDADGSNRHPMHDRPESHIPTPGNHARWSPDGTKIAFDLCVNCQVATNIQLFVYSFATDSVTQLTDTTYTSNTNPAWSPNGRKIAFVSNRDDSNGSNVYLMDLTNYNITRLTQSGNAGRPFWFTNNNLGYWSKNKLYQLDLRNINASNIPVELGEDLGFRPFQSLSNGTYILLHLFNLSNPRKLESIQLLDLNKNELFKIHSHKNFSGADWFHN